MNIGLPRSLFYYYYSDKWKFFLESLNIPYIESPNTTNDILLKGENASQDEMCLAFKIYLGHIKYLKDKCTHILVPRIANYNSNSQTCTNFLSAYDIINSWENVRIINYNIDLENKETEKKAFLEIGKALNKTKVEINKAYKIALYKEKIKKEKDIKINLKKLESEKSKILLVSHPYNTYDNLIGKPIIKYLKENNIEVIYSDKFPKNASKLSKKISKELYFKSSKENLGALAYSMNKIDGIIFLSAFPCALDALANELAMRKIKKPNINIYIDEQTSFTGIETRLESFIDMLKGVKYA